MSIFEQILAFIVNLVGFRTSFLQCLPQFCIHLVFSEAHLFGVGLCDHLLELFHTILGLLDWILQAWQLLTFYLGEF